jgi:hypothetical protein
MPKVTRKTIEDSPKIPQPPMKPAPQDPTQGSPLKNLTIFGKPQTKIDPELKICTYCNSKIKKMWSICPICGKNL